MTIQLPEHREALIRLLVEHGAFPSEEAAIDKAFQLLEEQYDDMGKQAEPRRNKDAADRPLVDALNQRLLAAGLVTQLPDPAQDIDDGDPDDQPIELEGEPLSVTIIRERRCEITPALLGDAAGLADKHSLRAYDAVQLAGALALQAQGAAVGLGAITLVSADQELNGAALAEGMTVEDPNNYA